MVEVELAGERDARHAYGDAMALDSHIDGHPPMGLSQGLSSSGPR